MVKHVVRAPENKVRLPQRLNLGWLQRGLRVVRHLRGDWWLYPASRSPCVVSFGQHSAAKQGCAAGDDLACVLVLRLVRGVVVVGTVDDVEEVCVNVWMVL
jgi:hypothetical protein